MILHAQSARKIIRLFNKVIKNDQNGAVTEEEKIFEKHMKNNLLHKDGSDHLPILVFSYVIPTLLVQFLLHIMLSMGTFTTEFDIVAYTTLR